MTFADDMAAATKQAVCGWLAEGGNAALGAAVLQGLRTPGGQVPSLAAGLGLLALNYGCNYNPSAFGDYRNDVMTGCTQTASGTMTISRYVSGQWLVWDANVVRVFRCYRKGTSPGGIPLWSFHFLNSGGQEYKQDEGGQAGWTATRTELNPGATCATNGSSFPPVSTPQPVINVTTSSGCQINVEHASWLIEADGNVRPVVKISKAGALLNARASGGVIGGCNFNSLVVVGGGGDGQPPWVAPWQDLPTPDGGEPWWYPLLRGAAAGATEWAVERVMQGLFGAKLPATVYRLQSACEVNAAGDPLDEAVEVTIPALPLMEGVAARVDALEDLMQGLKDFRQPVCYKSPLTGQPVTVNFREADANSVSHRLLDKRLSYQVPEGTAESAIVAHWEGFQWNSGPVTVTCRGTSMGSVHVWAETEAEGRRVIEHAAASAGADLMAPGVSWQVGRVKAVRYGRVAPMRACSWDLSGKRMVSARKGPSGSPSWRSSL